MIFHINIYISCILFHSIFLMVSNLLIFIWKHIFLSIWKICKPFGTVQSHKLYTIIPVVGTSLNIYEKERLSQHPRSKHVVVPGLIKFAVSVMNHFFIIEINSYIDLNEELVLSIGYRYYAGYLNICR